MAALALKPVKVVCVLGAAVDVSSKRRRMKILLVESCPVARERLGHLFDGEDQTYEVLTAFTGEAAMDLFVSDHPDLLLININVRGLPGREVCRQVRGLEGQRHTGVIFLTDSAQEFEAASVECLELGADDFLRPNCSPAELKARINAVLRLKAMTDELRNVNHRLQLLSLTDDLTGLANMRQFNQKFMSAIKQCRDGTCGLGVIMMDLDHFKSVNDTANHLVGSHVIAETGRLMRSSQILDPDDLAARYGGDEFIVFCPGNDIERVRAKAEAIRRVVFQAKFVRDGVTIRITSSLGVAWTAPAFNGKAEDLIKAADLMLYRSKEQGRDCVSAMILRYPIDLDHISRTHLVNGDAGGDYDELARVNES